LDIQEIVNGLKQLGFTEYEARIYATLLRSHPLNGNAIATQSGVPGPKVYETLRKMQENEIVFQVSGGDKSNQIRYSPLPYAELLSRKEQAFMGNMNFLSEALAKISSMSDNHWTEHFIIYGYEAALEAIRTAIDEARQEIYISCWMKQLEQLMEPLKAAHDRGVRIISLTFDQPAEKLPWRNIVHLQGKALLRHDGEFSFVMDQKQAINFQMLHDSPHAVVSSHPVTIATTRNYIRHDLFLNRVTMDFEKEFRERYGPDQEAIIDEF
jgi:sugar-specific transcriptional regulator TrmB